MGGISDPEADIPSLDTQGRAFAKSIFRHTSQYCDFGAVDVFFADKGSRRTLNHIVLNFRYSVILLGGATFDEEYLYTYGNAFIRRRLPLITAQNDLRLDVILTPSICRMPRLPPGLAG